MSGKNNESYIYQTWNKKIAIRQSAANDLELLGAFFNAHKNIFMLSYSALKKTLYLSTYDAVENKLSMFKSVGPPPEEAIYSASVYEDNEQYLRWYLLGKTTIWQLELIKNNWGGTINSFPKNYYPLAEKHAWRDHEGSSLVVFDKLPWILGGMSDVNGIDMSRRIIIGARWWTHQGKEGGYAAGYFDKDYLIHGRTAPIVHMYDEKILCISGNKKNKDNIVEFSYVKPYYEGGDRAGLAREDAYSKRFTNERSIVAYEGKNCSIETHYPRPASCVMENCIFIFSNQIYKRESIYYKYHFASGRSSGSGNGDWEFLIPSEDPDNLRFSSAKAVSLGRSIILILFASAAGNNSSEFLEDEETYEGGTKITIFEIK